MTTKQNALRSQPIYDTSKANSAYQLRYTWTGWPSGRTFERTPTELLEPLKPLWETDGIRLLEHKWTEKQVQLLFSAKPFVSPEFLAGRAKGRLDYALRSAGLRIRLSRKLGVRSVGDNVTREVKGIVSRGFRSCRTIYT